MTTEVMTQQTLHTAAEAHPTGRHAEPARPGNGMGGSLPTGPNHILHARVLARGTERLLTRYSALEPDVVRSTVNAAYRDLNRAARLKTYLPTLAIRQAEDTLRGLAAGATEGLTHHPETEEAAPAAA